MTALPAAIVDSHHHLWDLSRINYPWLGAAYDASTFILGEYYLLCRNYLPQDFRESWAGMPVVGHNIRYDLTMLRAENLRHTTGLAGDLAGQQNFHHVVELHAFGLEGLVELAGLLHVAHADHFAGLAAQLVVGVVKIGVGRFRTNKRPAHVAIVKQPGGYAFGNKPVADALCQRGFSPCGQTDHGDIKFLHTTSVAAW